MRPRLPSFLVSNSLQITIAVSYSMLVGFTIFFLGTTALVLTRDALWDSSTYYTEQLVEQVQAGIGTYLGEMDRVATGLLGNPEIEALLEDPESAEQRGRVVSLFRTVTEMRPDISLLALASPGIQPLLHDPGLRLNPAVEPATQQWYRAAVEARGGAVYSGARVQNLIGDRYRWVISLSRAAGDTVILVDLNFRVIEQLARSVRLGPRGYLFITDDGGNIVYHPQQQLIYSDLVEEPIAALLEPGTTQLVSGAGSEERLYVVTKVPRTGWRVVAASAVDQLLASQRRLRSYYLSWVALCFAVVMVLALLLSRRISQPVLRLRRSMQAVEQGDFSVEVQVDRRDEIGALSRDFSIMLATVRDLMARNEREQEEKRRAEIDALQHQITPHFLYNTLDSIVWMAEGGRMEQVIEMTTNLARLLRTGIGHGEALVPLRTELEHLESYLRIQQMRYRDHLTYEVTAADETLATMLPRLTLQPLVENAIYHGVKNRHGGGTVSVTCRPVDGHVEITVRDNGPGIDPAVLEDLRSSCGAPINGHVGLLNVQRRLTLTFGGDYGLDLASPPGEGTIVTVTIPGGTG